MFQSDYQGLTWVPASESLMEMVRGELRLQTETFNSWKITDQWKEDRGYVGLPRVWAQERGYITNSVLGENTSFPEVSPEYRYNQEQVVNEVLSNLLETGGCLIEAPMGWGKTFTACVIAAKLGVKTLVLTHKTDLVTQWKKAIKDFGIFPGHIQGNKLDYAYPISVATMQTVYSRLYDLPKEFFRAFGLIIIDECHRMPADTFAEVLNWFPARFRIGLSATWRRKDGLEPVWENSISRNIVRGVKTDIPIKYKQVFYKGFNDRDFYFRGEISHTHCINAIATNRNYNNFLAQGIRKHGNNLLCVSHRIEQLEILREILSDLDIGIYAGRFQGRTMKKEELEEASKKPIILGTYGKIGEGTDIPRIDKVMLLTPCTDPEQVAGRASRPFPGKTQATIYDIVIDTGYTLALSRKREKIYESMGAEKL